MKRKGTTMVEVMVALAILSGAMYYAYNATPTRDTDSAQYLESLRTLVLQSLQEAKSMGVTQLPGPGQCMTVDFNANATVATASAMSASSSSACDPLKAAAGKFRVTLTSTASPTLDPAPDFGVHSATMKLPVLSSTFRRLDVVGGYSQNGKTGTVQISALKRF